MLFVIAAVACIVLNAIPASAQQGWSGSVIPVSTALAQEPAELRAAVDPAGNVVVAWSQSGEVRAARYSAAEHTWGEVAMLGPYVAWYAIPAVALDSAGNGVVAWVGPGAVVAARYTASTGTWSASLPLSIGQFPGDPVIGMDAAGNAAVVWGDSGLIKECRFSASTGTWSPPIDFAEGYLPDLAVDPAGNAIVISVRGDSFDAIAVRAVRYSAQTETWGSAIELAPVRQVSGRPRVAIDPDGDAIAMWSGRTSPTFAIQVARFAAGTGTWDSVTTLGPAAGPPVGNPGLAIGAAGHAIVLWSAPGGVVRASRYDPITSEWAGPGDVSATGVGAEAGDVVIDSDGGAVAVWREADRLVRGAFSGVGAGWSASTTLSLEITAGYPPQLVRGVNGNITALWGSAATPCPPECSGGVRSRRWSGAPATPVITGVAPGPTSFDVHFSPPITVGQSFAATNYAYSLDDGLTWTVRAPASVVSPVVIGGLVPLRPYVIRLRAINSAGDGLISAPVTALPGAVPGPSTNLTATSIVGNVVTLDWRPPPGPIQPTAYFLEGGTMPNETLVSVSTGLATPRVTFVAPTGAFYVRVVSVSGGVRSAPSNEIRLFVNVPTVPSAPTNLLGLVNGSSLALSWTNTFAGGEPTGLSLNVSGAIAATLPLPVTDAVAYLNVPPGTYTLNVSATNAAGTSAPSNAVRLTLPGPCSGAPGTPTNFRAWRLGPTILVAWSPPASGPAATSYRVSVGGAYTGSVDTAGLGLSGVARPGSYSLGVAAQNPCGTGAAAPTQTIVIP